MKIYEYAIILQPKYEDDKKVEPGRLIVVDKVLADDDKQAQILIHRAIPEEVIDEIDRVTVAIRPF